MKSLILNLRKKPFVNNVIIMASGTAAAQVISMAVSPITTRLYGPEVFGLLGVFTSIVGIIAPIVALTYPTAIVLPKNDSDAKGLVRLSLYTIGIITTIVSFILLIFNQSIIGFFHIEDIAPFLYLIPIFVLFSGLLEVIEQWLIRTKQFGISAKAAVWQSIILNGSKVGIGFYYPFSSTLIILTTIGQALKAVMMFRWSRNSKHIQTEKKYEDLLSIKELAKKYMDFPKYRAPEVFINTASQSLPILMLTGFFGPASAGFYSICKTVLSMPSTLIGKSVGDVFYPRISEAAHNGEKITNLIVKATMTLAVVGVLPYGIIFIFGPWIFSFIFGSEWIIAGEYARWISLWSFFGFINIPSVKSLPVLSAQQFQLKFTILMLIIRITVLAIGYYVFANDNIAISFFGISGAVLNLLLILITVYKSNLYDQSHQKSNT